MVVFGLLLCLVGFSGLLVWVRRLGGVCFELGYLLLVGLWSCRLHCLDFDYFVVLIIALGLLLALWEVGLDCGLVVCFLLVCVVTWFVAASGCFDRFLWW